MANWGNYQSVIQLGAALNFAYASLEAILQQPLVILSEHQAAALIKLRNKIAQRELLPLAHGAIQGPRWRMEMVDRAGRFICGANPYLSSASGFIAIVLLVYSSEFSNRDLTPVHRAAAIIISYGWFTLSLMLQLILRTYIKTLMPILSLED